MPVHEGQVSSGPGARERGQESSAPGTFQPLKLAVPKAEGHNDIFKGHNDVKLGEGRKEKEQTTGTHHLRGEGEQA